MKEAQLHLLEISENMREMSKTDCRSSLRSSINLDKINRVKYVVSF